MWTVPDLLLLELATWVIVWPRNLAIPAGDESRQGMAEKCCIMSYSPTVLAWDGAAAEDLYFRSYLTLWAGKQNVQKGINFPGITGLSLGWHCSQSVLLPACATPPALTTLDGVSCTMPLEVIQTTLHSRMAGGKPLISITSRSTLIFSFLPLLVFKAWPSFLNMMKIFKSIIDYVMKRVMWQSADPLHLSAVLPGTLRTQAPEKVEKAWQLSGQPWLSCYSVQHCHRVSQCSRSSTSSPPCWHGSTLEGG